MYFLKIAFWVRLSPLVQILQKTHFNDKNLRRKKLVSFLLIRKTREKCEFVSKKLAGFLLPRETFFILLLVL